MSKVITFPCISGDIGKYTRNIIVMVADCKFSEIDKKCLCKNNIKPNDILLVTTNDNNSQLCKVQNDYELKSYLNLSIKELFFEINKPKTINDAKSNKYSMGEIVNIVDYSSKSITHSPFMCFIYTKKPSWFDKDIPNCIYEVSGSSGKTLLINLALSSSSELILTQDQAIALKHLLNNTGKIFYEPSKKTLCVMVDNVIKAITLQPMEKQS